jgi:hypothetical protein
MPSRSLPVAMTNDAPTQVPKKSRKRPAARKIASDPARKRTKAKTKASQHVVIQPLLQLPAPRPLLLLTYAGPSHQIDPSVIAVDLPRPIERPSAPQIIHPGPELDDTVGHDMPCGSLPAALPDDAPAKAPKRKRKHPAARKTGGKLERRQKTIKTKSSRHVPTPPPLPLAPQLGLPLLTGAEDQIGSGASAIDLARSNEQLSAPQIARAETQPTDAARQDQSASSGTRPAGLPETLGETPRRPVLPRVRRAYSIGPRIAATVGFTAAVIGAVLLLARPSPIKPTDTITQHNNLMPADTALTRDTSAQQDIGRQQHIGPQQHIGAQQDIRTQQDIGAHQDLGAHQDIGAKADAAARTTAQPTAFAPAPEATEVNLTEVSSLAGLSGIQPFTVAFSDHPDGQPTDPVTGLIAFDNWAATRPAQKQFLSPFPGYTEKVLPAGADGDKKPPVEKLHMYVAEARFVIAKPPHAIDLAQYVSIGYLEGIDAAIKHRLIRPEEADNNANPNPARRWCEPQGSVLCIESHYQLEGKLPSAIRLLNQITSGKKIADYLEFQSELRVVPLAELDQKGLAKLTGLDAPVTGVLEETIFRVNQIMQFGKFLVVLQQDAADSNRTMATAVIALALKTRLIEKQKRFEDVPVLHNLVPAQVLTGRSTFNTGASISAGLPLYARSNIKAVAATLERE